jgi:molybdenum cofactor guanylyltransferase
MSAAQRAALGIILAGGASSRFPGGKAGATLGSSTLLAHAVRLVRAARLEPVVCAREGTVLPEASAAIWREPAADAAPHPLRGIGWAVERAGAPMVFLPVDLPLLTPAVLRGLATAPGSALVGRAGRPAALVGRIEPDLAQALAHAAETDAPALRTLVGLGASVVDLDALDPGAGPHALVNVNDPESLAQVQAMLGPGR